MKFLKMTMTMTMELAQRVPEDTSVGPYPVSNTEVAEMRASMEKVAEGNGGSLKKYEIETTEVVEV